MLAGELALFKTVAVPVVVDETGAFALDPEAAVACPEAVDCAPPVPPPPMIGEPVADAF